MCTAGNAWFAPYVCCQQVYDCRLHVTRVWSKRHFVHCQANLILLLYSLKDRQWQVRQHSPIQEEARQRAADELVKQQYSWLGPLAGMFARNMQQGSSNVRSEESHGRDQVGQRRRAPAAAAAARAQQQATIPVERSLVVISKQDK